MIAPWEASAGDPLDAEEHDDFDASTDFDSRAIAERFAPAAAKRRAGQPRALRRTAPRPSLSTRAASAQSEPPRWPARRRASLRLSALRLEPAAASAAAKSSPELTQAALRGTARLLEEVLADFSIKGEVREIKPGPVVTLFELEPARGTKSSRVVALAEDIARSMSVTSARAAVVPGRSVIGIELPNVRRETVYLRDILESDAFGSSELALPMALGKSIGGEPIVADLARMPHLLVAGTTGSGKSVGVNAMVLSLLFRRSPEECRLLMIDPKMLELSVYNGIPHLLTPVVTDPHKAVAALTGPSPRWRSATSAWRASRCATSRRSISGCARQRAAARAWRAPCRPVSTASTGQAVYEQQESRRSRCPSSSSWSTSSPIS